MVEKACRKCRLISDENVCPNCKSTDLSDDYSGSIMVFNPETSALAKTMEIERKGRYAIRIR